MLRTSSNGPSEMPRVVGKRMHSRLFNVEDHEPFIGQENVDRILKKAKAFQGFRVVNFNSTFLRHRHTERSAGGRAIVLYFPFRQASPSTGLSPSKFQAVAKISQESKT